MAPSVFFLNNVSGHTDGARRGARSGSEGGQKKGGVRRAPSAQRRGRRRRAPRYLLLLSPGRLDIGAVVAQCRRRARPGLPTAGNGPI